MKNKLAKLLLIVTFLAVADFSYAQPPPPPPTPGVPIDGGLGFLAAAGAAYGIKKFRDGRKSQKNEKN